MSPRQPSRVEGGSGIRRGFVMGGRVLPSRRGLMAVVSLILASFSFLGPQARAAAMRFREFHLPTAGSLPYGITVGSDQNLWFAEYGTNKIGRTTTVGVGTEFSVPTVNGGPFESQPGRTATSGLPSRAATRSGGSPRPESSPASSTSPPL
jgi:hypothetical protein